MSWNFKYVGSAAMVAQAVEKESQFPESLKKAVGDMLSHMTADPGQKAQAFEVTSTGHFDTSQGLRGDYFKLEVVPVNLLADQADAKPVQEGIGVPGK